MSGMNDRFLKFSKPFITAAKGIFETMVYTKIEPSTPTIKKDNISKGDYSAILGISGDVEKDGKQTEYKGTVVISFPEETFLKVASAMLMEEYTEYSDEISDVGGEIVNMIIGNAKKELVVMGFSTNMAIPSMISGKGHTISYPEGTTMILIPINSAHGEFFIEVGYVD